MAEYFSFNSSCLRKRTGPALVFLAVALILSLVSCGKNEDSAKPKTSTARPQTGAAVKPASVSAAQVRALCLEVMKLAAKDKSAKKLPPAVNDRFTREICPQLPVRGHAYWQCMQRKMSSGSGFYAAEKVCKRDS